MSNSIIFPSSKEAQQLYLKYSTLENTANLSNHLKTIIDKNFLLSMHNQNIHAIYNDIILKYYPNEICIKANFINQVLLKGKSHVTIFELPVSSSRIDLCKINGTSTAYEIKTDFDNFNRLEKQIEDYYKIFEEVYIICSETNIANVINLIPEKCGMYAYRQTKSGKYIFKLYRNAVKSFKIDSTEQLKILRISELNHYFNIKINFSNKKDLIEYIKSNYSFDTINHAFKQILKRRFKTHWEFLKQNCSNIYEIDYQWFYKNLVIPSRIYK